MSTARACHMVRGASVIAARQRPHLHRIRPNHHAARKAETATVLQSVPSRVRRRLHGHHAASFSSSSSSPTMAPTDLSNLPSHVRIVEVGPRDGLQNEPDPISADDKVELVRLLADAGCPAVEVAAFVSPRWVPQMADSDEVLRRSVERRREHQEHGEDSDSAASTTSSPTTLSCLTPNLKGFERAMESGPPDEVAIFASASEAFSRANINCSIDESLRRYREVADAATAAGVHLRGYVSCVLGCPYQGHVDVDDVARVSARLVDMGCREVSLGDTIGVGTPGATLEMIGAVRDALGGNGDGNPCSLAVHFHDTYGQALANIYAALTVGVDVVDCSVGGLGGCPYAGPGASGNVATEDVVYMLHGMGIDTGIDLEGLVKADDFICNVLNRPTRSRAAAAIMASKAKAGAADAGNDGGG